MLNSKPNPAASEAPTQPSGGFPWGPVLLVSFAVLIGFSFIGIAIYFALPNNSAAPAPTLMSVLPTVAPLPSVTMAPNVVAAAPTSPTPPTTAPTAASAVLNVMQDANVRSGPGFNYPVLGGLLAGTSVTVIGRDSSAQWFVIAYGAGSSGQGWISSIVATYTGDTNSLTVITAPPPPPPTNTAPPAAPTNTPAPAGYNSRGIIGDSFSVDSASVGVNADLWFRFKVHNSAPTTVSYGVLSIHSDTGPNGASWSNSSFSPGAVLEWSDHINIGTPGTYTFYLGICYGERSACLANAQPWERLSGNVTVTVH